MTSLENTADLMESADDQLTVIAEKLDRILRESVDISSFTLADHKLVFDLKVQLYFFQTIDTLILTMKYADNIINPPCVTQEMDDRLQSEMRKISERGAKEERQGLEATSPSHRCQALHSSVHHLEQLRQQLERVQSAARALDHFLATAREVKAEIPSLLAKQDPSRQQNEANWEQERQSWQAAMRQKLQTAVEQSDSVDSTLKAVGMTLTMDGATATCRDVVTSLSQQAVDAGKELMRARKRKDELFPTGKEQIQENEVLNPKEMCQAKAGGESPREHEHPTPKGMGGESGMEAKRSRLEGDNDTQREEVHKAQTCKSGEDVLEAKGQRRRRSSQVKKEGEEEKSFVQRSVALLGTLREIKGAAEQLGLQEPTLPALQQRYNTDLGS